MNTNEINRTNTIDILNKTKRIADYTITSVSGGKTSSYMAIHYPTDYYIFACVLTEDSNCQIKDKGIKKEIQKKLPQYEASRELDSTLINLLKLEQLLGKEIVWVAGETYDKVINTVGYGKYLPNRYRRYCTQYLKFKPIFEWCYLHLLQPVLSSNGNLESFYPIEMNVGFRADETKRVYKALNAIKEENGLYNFSDSGSCLKWDSSLKCDITGRFRNKHRHTSFTDWAFRQFPLFENNITHDIIKEYWSNKGWIFPEISNCDFCFFHKKEELKRQLELYPERFDWWATKEIETGGYFSKSIVYSDFINLDSSLEDDFDCNCTD